MYDLTLREQRQFKKKFQVALSNCVKNVVDSYRRRGELDKLANCKFFFTNYLRNDKGNFAQVYLHGSQKTGHTFTKFVQHSFVVLSIIGEDELVGLKLLGEHEVADGLTAEFNDLIGVNNSENKFEILDQERIALGLNFDLLEESPDCEMEIWYKE